MKKILTKKDQSNPGMRFLYGQRPDRLNSGSNRFKTIPKVTPPPPKIEPEKVIEPAPTQLIGRREPVEIKNTKTAKKYKNSQEDS